MTWNIFKFELKYHFRNPLFYILSVLFFLMTFGAVTTDAVQIGGSVGNVNRNAPFVIMQFLLVMSVFGVLVATAYVSNAVYRDFELNTDSLFFSAPLKKRQYLTGRFAAAFTVTAVIGFSMVLAIMAGSKMWWLDKARIGPFALTPYLFSFFVLILPNLFLFAAVFFAVAALTRSLLWTYVSVAAFYVGYAVSRVIINRNLENLTVKSLADPFGLTPFFLLTRYWTVFDKNTRILPIEGAFLWNRVLWTSVALCFLALTFWRFRMQVSMAAGRRHRVQNDAAPVQPESVVVPHVSQRFDRAASLQQYISTVRVECASILRSLPFIVILLLGVLNALGNSFGSSVIFGTAIYPVTHVMVSAINNGFVGFAVIIVAFYAGEVVWRERSARLSEVFDATPAPTSALWAGKLTALLVMLYAALAAAVLTTMAVQIGKRYFNLELGVYLKSIMLVTGTEIVMFAVLMFFAQVVFNNRNLGYLVALLYLVGASVLSALHYEHVLYRLFDEPVARYSDMNGFGHYLPQRLWLTMYWFLFAGVMLLVAHLLWLRGSETAWKQRMRIARQRFGGPALVTIAVLLVGFAATGAFIYYNTNIMNRYETGDEREKRAADTEKRYKKYERMPQPRIIDAQAEVDIYPEKRWLDARGRYTLVNKTGASLRDIYVSESPDVPWFACTIPGASIVFNDRVHGYTIYRLAQPMAPGASLPLTFELKIHHGGFENQFRDNTIVENGTFVNNYAIFPHLGYTPTEELQDAAKRRKYGLAPVQRMPRIDDRAAAMNNELSREADWIDLDTTVSTSPDQIAIAPGYLQREWTANGRRYFRYKTTSKILPFWSYLSARYSVKRGDWHGVPIEIYYDARHPYNVDRMIDAVKKSLDYFSANFSPYQHRQVRIIEFPNYAQFAQSFPNTIPWSEGLGFIADLRDKDDIDYVFYVGAHEMAHQWWGHQVVGADVQGSTMITETLAQYSALMVMEKEYGRDKMRRFLKFELDRYLNGRGGELVAEMPLMLVENQPYIHYRKGSVVMYSLREAIGEEHVNAALRNFIRDHAFKAGPYPTTRELVAEFRAQTPPERQQLITDLFETITLYDNKATAATWKRRADGKYVVRVTVEAKKLRSNASGSEQPVPLDDWIEIGVLDDTRKVEKAKVLALEKHHITTAKSTFEIVVPQKPGHAGIDPLDKLVDRNPDDNMKAVEGS